MCNKQFFIYSDGNIDNNRMNQNENKGSDTVNVLDDNIIRLFEFSKEKVDETLRKKQHIEIKTLYLLQATSLVTALLGAFSGESNIFSLMRNFKDNNIEFSTILYLITYLVMIISIGILVLSLKDTLVSWKFTRVIIKKIFAYDIDKELQLTNKVNKEIFKLTSKYQRVLSKEEIKAIEKAIYIKENYYYKDINDPYEIYLEYEKKYKNDPNKLYIKFIDNLNNTIKSGTVINVVKDKFFSTGLYLYVLSLISILIYKIS